MVSTARHRTAVPCGKVRFSTLQRGGHPIIVEENRPENVNVMETAVVRFIYFFQLARACGGAGLGGEGGGCFDVTSLEKYLRRFL